MVQITEIRNGAEDETVDTAQVDVTDGEVVANSDAGGEEGTDAADAQGDKGEAETLVVTIGDKPPEVDDDPALRDNATVRELREANREKAKQLKEQQRQIEALTGAKQGLGPRPKLEDFKYDEDAHADALQKWTLEKKAIDDEIAQKHAAEQKAQSDWQQTLNKFGSAEAEFSKKAPDYQDARANVEESLNQTQRGILISQAKDAPLVVYALHKNPSKLKELAAILNPVAFTWQLAQLEAQLKVSTNQQRKPEQMVQGVRHTGNVDDLMLAKLRKEAERTGDLSKVVAYKREKKAAK